ncbi:MULTISPECIES: hypothetical protein [Arthrobacter]|nr:MULTISPECIES: hypothetical protein [Arthrobacter]MBT8163499.1 hypothetical protein [Arthrobacter sp. GN70]
MNDAKFQAGDIPCSWDQNQALTSHSLGIKPRDVICRRWYVAHVGVASLICDAWRAVVSEHPALRVEYRRHTSGFWSQRVLSNDEVALWTTVGAYFPDRTSVQQFDDRVSIDTGQLFSFVVTPVFDGVVVELAIDHICIDGVSISLLIGFLNVKIALALNGQPLSEGACDTNFFDRCVKLGPDYRSSVQDLSRWPEVNPGIFPPMAEVEMTARPGIEYGEHKVSARISWEEMDDRYRSSAPGICGAALAQSVSRVIEGIPVSEIPLVAVLSGRTVADQLAVGMYFSYAMLAAQVGDDPLYVRARAVHGRILGAMRRSRTPFALEVLQRTPNQPHGRDYVNESTLNYLQVNHVAEPPELEVSDAVVEVLPVAFQERGYGLARARSVSRMNDLEFEITARTDYLGSEFASSVISELLTDIQR